MNIRSQDITRPPDLPYKPGTGPGRGRQLSDAGPFGLSAASHLAHMGHEVEIREAGPTAGGMMRLGIPACRMPRDVLDAVSYLASVKRGERQKLGRAVAVYGAGNPALDPARGRGRRNGDSQRR